MECVDAVFAGPLWRCYGAIWPIDDTSGICVNDSHPIVVVLLWTLLILCWLFIFWGGGGVGLWSIQSHSSSGVTLRALRDDSATIYGWVTSTL